MFVVGDEVQVAGDAESCCAAEDAGLFGVIVKIRKKGDNSVKTSAGVWRHCDNCITRVPRRHENVN
jgi:hypothetical protein